MKKNVQMDMFEGKFILKVIFNDGTCLHYILSDVYLTPILAAKSSDYFFLNNLPDVLLSDDLIKSVESIKAFSIGNGIEY